MLKCILIVHTWKVWMAVVFNFDNLFSFQQVLSNCQEKGWRLFQECQHCMLLHINLLPSHAFLFWIVGSKDWLLDVFAICCIYGGGHIILVWRSMFLPYHLHGKLDIIPLTDGVSRKLSCCSCIRPCVRLFYCPDCNDVYSWFKVNDVPIHNG